MDAYVREPAEQYESLSRQAEAATFGMWLFLGSELLFFAGLFAVYGAERAHYGDAFSVAARHTDLLLGSLNTLILLTSSYVVTLAASGPRRGSSARTTTRLLILAILLGIGFLFLKGTEYVEHFRDGIFPAANYHFAALPGNGARVFFTLYYFMTGLHAIHLCVGIGLMLWLASRSHRGDFDAQYSTPLELGGMYWHLVDIIWLFLWPAFYLVR